MNDTITFLVSGREVKSRSGASSHPSEFSQATVSHSMSLDRDRAVGDEAATVQAVKGRDIVVVRMKNGPCLYLHPENARDLFRGQQQRGGPRAAESGKVELPLCFDWPDAGRDPGVSRAGMNVVATTFEILSGNYGRLVAEWASSEIVQRVDSQVERGLYALTKTKPAGQLRDYAQVVPKLEASAAPVLVFIHGTFSSTYGTFSKLWEHPHLVDTLFKHYGKNIYALEHWTLAASPIENALELARALPPDTRLHLLTHSRGGLVAEVLAQVCGDPDDAADATRFFSDPAYHDQLVQLDELRKLVRTNNLSVERVVRVACPARGTLLASKRLDAYVSILKWSLELAGIPVAPALIEFIGAVAQQRTDPEKIPGLAAQMPESPMVRWLHAAAAPVPGQLRVVAGDVAADSLGSWVKTLVSDAYYWQDNDFVVQTSSMYGGVPRALDSAFFLDRAGEVSHFSYFARAEIAANIVDGLVNDKPRQFAPIGPQSRAGKSSSGKRGGDERPAVFVLPGIMGSNLQVDNERVWLSARVLNGLSRLHYAPDNIVTPDGAIDYTYGELIDYLGATHDVVEFAYDWRVPLQEEAERLAKAVMRALTERKEQPVRILAHSMGGLLARVFQLTQPSTWEAMFKRPNARLLMLGTPNGGSWAPMQVLSGDDDFASLLTIFGMPFAQGEARQMIASFPGFMQMQAGLLDENLGLGLSTTWSGFAARDAEALKKRSIWHNLQTQLKVFSWGIPSQAVLDKAVTLRRALDAQAAHSFPAPPGAVVMVVGKANMTPDGFEWEKNDLIYREAVNGGDGRVTLNAALLPGVVSWTVDREHGDLPRNAASFDAYLELLVSGTTQGLAMVGKAERGRPGNHSTEVAHMPAPRHLRQGRAGRPDQVASFSSALDVAVGRAKRGQMLEIRVINGNLKFVDRPIIVGHYSSSQLTGTEQALDGLIGGAMSATLGMGCYPNACGSHQVYLNVSVNSLDPLQMPRPKAVIVVGLGLEGALTASDLTKTVTHGVIAWAQRRHEERSITAQSFEIAATLIGSGGVNMSAESSTRAVARGVLRANTHLRARGWPTVGCLDFVEVYLDRATEAMRALRLLAEAECGHYEIHPDIVNGIGPQRRALGSGYRGARYDLISALQEQNADGSSMIVYSLNTRRAREDVHASRQQVNLVDLLIRSAASATGHADCQIGTTLFKLLVPPEIEPFLVTSEEMQIELNEGSAAIPWELLDSERHDLRDMGGEPWAIHAKLLRCLRTVGLPLTVNDAGGEGHFLIIGDPENLAEEYPQLEGARQEAAAVAEILEHKFTNQRVRRLIRGQLGGPAVTAPAVVSALLERDWRIVHIAGHGALPSSGSKVATPGGPVRQAKGGVVLSDNSFLGADEIGAMRTVPALVFINCCHLGNVAVEGGELLRAGDMPRFAASVAEALIRKGVRCVLAAGWEVDDTAACTFAQTFYECLTAGERFIEAVAKARTAAWKMGGNTWAAYQCYGDPNWTLTKGMVQQSIPETIIEGLDEIASVSALVLALESIITSYRYEHQDPEVTLDAVRRLETEFGERWGSIGVVAEAFGLARQDLNDYTGAADWLRRAVEADDATASMRCVEKYGNVLARLAWQQIRDASERHVHDSPGVREAYKKLELSIDLLQNLLRLSPTMERHASLGSAYKRLAMVRHDLAEGDWRADLKKSIKHYEEAQAISEATGQGWCYPTANACITHMVLDSGKTMRKPPFGEGSLYRLTLQEKNKTDPDFFSAIAQIEADIYDAIALDSLSEKCADILHELGSLYLRARGTRFWGPVLDQLDFVDSLWTRKVVQKERTARDELREFLSQCQL